MLKRFPIHIRRQGFDLGQAIFGGFAVVVDWSAFSPSRKLAIADFGDHHIHICLGTARYDKRTGDRPALNSGTDLQRQGASGSGSGAFSA